jgi:hypothetical protein
MGVPFAATAIAAVALATNSATAGVSTPAHPCRADLPHGPKVPAAVVFTSTCGMFRLGTDGSVVRLPRHWLASHGSGTGRRFGAHLQLRASREGRMTLRLRNSVVWRSASSYRSTVTSVAFGPNLFAFSVYRRGVYLTDLHTPERLVVRGRDVYPLDFTRSGRLIVLGRRTIALISRRGRVARSLAYVPSRGVALDPRADVLYFVSPGDVLDTLHGTHVRPAASVAAIDGSFSLADPGLLIWGTKHTLTVTTRDAEVVASATWPAELGSADLGVRPSADGALFAFRVSSASPGRRNAGSHVLLLRRGEHAARELFSHRYAQVGCGLLGNMSWHDHSLLYDSGLGQPLIFDVDHDTHSLALAGLALRLPHQGKHDVPTATWLSDFAR